MAAWRTLPPAMMLAVFSALSVAALAAWSGARGVAAFALAATFSLALGLFLWEVWSPATGFRMPWLQG